MKKCSSLRRCLALILLLSLLLYLPGLWSREFSTRGEPREALVAQAMIQSGNWILPRTYNDAVPSKPPLLHWCIAALATVSGELNEGTSRLPSMIAATCFGLLLLAFLWRERGPAPALWSTLLLMTSFEWFRAATSCRVDMLLAACTCWSVLLIYRWKDGRYPYLLLISLVGATLSKGPVGIILPGIIFVSWGLLERHSLRLIASRAVVVFLPALFLASIWYIVAYLSHPADFAQKVWYENVARFFGTQADEPHKKSVWYLYGTLWIGFLPWSLLLLPTKINWPNIKRWQVREWWRSLDSFGRYSVVVTALILIFFSIPSSKRSVYLLPLYPFVASWLGSQLVSLSETREGNLQIIRFMGSPKRVLAVVMAILVMGNGLVFSLVSRRLSPRAFSQEIRSLVSEGERLYSYGTEFYGLSFYLSRKMYRFEDFKPQAGLVVLQTSDREEFSKELGQESKVELVRESEGSITQVGEKAVLVRFEKGGGV